MGHWTFEIEEKGTSEEDHVHSLRLGLLLLYVHKEPHHKLWTITLLWNTSDAGAIGDEEFEEDLLKAQVRAMCKAIELLEKDGNVLAQAMQEVTGVKLGEKISEH